MSKRYMVIAPSYIGAILVAAGSFVNQDDIGYGADGKPTKPGSNLIEVDDDGNPVDKADLIRLQGVPIAGREQIAAVAPHAPNPTRPQALPSTGPFDVMIGRDGGYEPSQGVESDEAKQARIDQLEAELATLRGVNASIVAGGDLEPEKPKRRAAGEGKPAKDATPATPTPPASPPAPPLTPEAQSLVNANDKPTLLALAADYEKRTGNSLGVTDDNNKGEIATKLVEAEKAATTA